MELQRVLTLQFAPLYMMSSTRESLALGTFKQELGPTALLINSLLLRTIISIPIHIFLLENVSMLSLCPIQTKR